MQLLQQVRPLLKVITEAFLRDDPLPTLTYGDPNVESHVTEGGEVLLIVNVEDTVGEDLHSCVVGELVSQLPGPLEAIDEGRGVAHDGMEGHHI